MFRRWFVLVLTASVLFSAADFASARRSKGLKDHLAMGNPDDAANDADKSPDKFLMDKDLFALSYNSKNGTPNWASWRLVQDDFGEIERKDKFKRDDELKVAGLTQVLPSEYEGTGFDSGHMCPNGDRDLDDESAAKTFVMSNMVPQAAALNQQSWKNLEIHCQNLARKGKELYIICGPHGRGGQGEVIKRKKIDGKFKIIEKRIVFETGIGKDERITVPAHCWKVILILEGGEGDPLERVTEMSEVIAVIMANDTTPKKWRDHRVTIAEVEKLTRFKFLSNVKEEVRKALLKRGPEDTGRLESAPRWFARGAFDVFLFHAASRVNGRAL